MSTDTKKPRAGLVPNIISGLATGLEDIGEHGDHGTGRNHGLWPDVRVDPRARPCPLRRPDRLSAYLGAGESCDQALAEFAAAYADQNERDHQALTAAVKSGRIKAETGI